MIPARRRTVPLLAVLAAIAALALVACGSDKTPSTAQGILKDTFGPGKPIRSGRLDLAVTFRATGLAGLDQPVKLAFTGPFQSQGGKTLPAFDLTADLGLRGTSLKAGAVSTGKQGYLSFQGTPYELPPELYKELQQGFEQSSKDAGKKGSGPSLGSLGVHPLRWLKAPKIAGSEKIGGTDTTHVTATVDVPKLLVDVDTLLKKAGKVGGAAGQAAGALPSSLTAKQRRLIADSVKTATFDVWAGKKDGTLRKLDIKVGFDVPEAGRADAGGLKAGSLRIGVTINELNEKQTITPPKNARPFSDLQGPLGQLLGGAVGGTQGSGGGQSSGSSGVSPAAPAAPQSRYTQCLQAAGRDIAKQSDCAKLLNR